MRLSICFFVVQLLLSLFQAVGGGLVNKEEQELLDAHNYLRSIVVPPATNMQKMVTLLGSYKI